MDQYNMAKSSAWLNEFASNVTSQNGEDGIIEKILDVLDDSAKWCVEFGSWDGRHLSNTYNLIKNKSWSGVLIEGNAHRFQDLLKTYEGNNRVICINAFVGFEGDNNLDVILRRADIPADFDLLSIDIDGNDYHVWEAVRDHRPKIVVIEYNPTIPNAVEFVQSRDMRVTQGSSLLSLWKLAKAKNYELVAVTHSNAIFVDLRYFGLFGIEDNTVGAMRSDESLVTYLFNGYDGTVFIRGSGKLGWHGLPYRESKVQVLPRWLRDYPRNYGRVKRMFAKLYRSAYKRNII
ncbi:MAG: FkbM family methyltransferase [Phycisphaerales bacterium]|nr:MAG: FkbM family methyltransferase [Phycisphaerales bacterium]